MANKKPWFKCTIDASFTLTKIMGFCILISGTVFSIINPDHSVMEVTIMFSGATVLGKTGFEYLSKRYGMSSDNTVNTIEVEDPPPPVPESK